MRKTAELEYQYQLGVQAAIAAFTKEARVGKLRASVGRAATPSNPDFDKRITQMGTPQLAQHMSKYQGGGSLDELYSLPRNVLEERARRIMRTGAKRIT